MSGGLNFHENLSSNFARTTKSLLENKLCLRKAIKLQNSEQTMSRQQLVTEQELKSTETNFKADLRNIETENKLHLLSATFRRGLP